MMINVSRQYQMNVGLILNLSNSFNKFSNEPTQI